MRDYAIRVTRIDVAWVPLRRYTDITGRKVVTRVAVKTNWDHTTLCCKADCSNVRSERTDGTFSLMCDRHVREWEARIAQLLQAHPYIERPERRPVPAAVFTDAALCARCNAAPRQAADSLCEECRSG